MKWETINRRFDKNKLYIINSSITNSYIVYLRTKRPLRNEKKIDEFNKLLK